MIDDEETIKISFYFGQSMKGVFHPGDLVLYRNIPFFLLRSGDIITFSSPTDKHRIVHRIIHAHQEYVITQGDNNPLPDKMKITPEHIPMLVTGFDRMGKIYAVRRGKMGLLSFRYHQLKLSLRRMRGKAMAPLIKHAPLRHFKSLLPPLEKYRFGEKEFLYCGKRYVAEKLLPSGRWIFRTQMIRLFYSRRDLLSFIEDKT